MQPWNFKGMGECQEGNKSGAINLEFLASPGRTWRQRDIPHWQKGCSRRPLPKQHTDHLAKPPDPWKQQKPDAVRLWNWPPIVLGRSFPGRTLWGWGNSVKKQRWAKLPNILTRSLGLMSDVWSLQLPADPDTYCICMSLHRACVLLGLSQVVGCECGGVSRWNFANRTLHATWVPLGHCQRTSGTRGRGQPCDFATLWQNIFSRPSSPMACQTRSQKLLLVQCRVWLPTRLKSTTEHVFFNCLYSRQDSTCTWSKGTVSQNNNEKSRTPSHSSHP